MKNSEIPNKINDPKSFINETKKLMELLDTVDFDSMSFKEFKDVLYDKYLFIVENINRSTAYLNSNETLFNIKQRQNVKDGLEMLINWKSTIDLYLKRCGEEPFIKEINSEADEGVNLETEKDGHVEKEITIDESKEIELSRKFSGVEERLKHIINKKFCRDKLTGSDEGFIKEHKSTYKKVRKILLKPYEDKYEDVFNKFRVKTQFSESDLLRHFDKELEDKKPELAKIITDNFIKWIKANTKFRVTINLNTKGKKIIILEYT